jgi:polyisoprenyl-phosphate glycosyltransferase
MALISVVIPVYNEAKCLRDLAIRLFNLEKTVDDGFEYIFVNDGSNDESLEILRSLEKTKANVKYISFSRNFGHEVATTAGIDHASGDAIVIIDADLQDPPELISELIQKWKQGYHIVYAQRKTRKGEKNLVKLASWLFYRVFRSVSNINMPTDTGDFRLVDRRVANQLLICREQNRFIRGLVSWTGFKQISVFYDRDERFAGQSKYNLIKRGLLAMDAFLGFSTAPLRFVLIFSIIICLFSIVMLGIIIVQKLFFAMPIKGYALLASAIFFLSGVQLFVMGLIGEYVGRIYTHAQNRPLYIISEKSESLLKGNEGINKINE